MDWYVDNVDGSDANDGHTTAAAKETLAGVFDAGDFTDIAAGHDIYMKATGIDYAHAVVKTLVDNITIDRHPTDVGTSRPVINAGNEASTNGYCLIVANNNKTTLKNIHLKGLGIDGGFDNYGIIHLSNGLAKDIALEDCIIEQRFSYSAIRFNFAFGGDVILRRCHIWRHVNDIDNAGGGLLTEDSASSTIEGLILEDNVIENYVYVIRNHYRLTTSVFDMDHNTFVECGRTAEGRIVELSAFYLGTSFSYTNNTVSNTEETAGSEGIHGIDDDFNLTADYNNWYNIETPYEGSQAPTPAHDMNVEPSWQGGSKEWIAAHIVLASYYAPITSQTILVYGDSNGSTIGAIVVEYATSLDVAYVDNTVSASGDGTTEETALKTINEAMLAINNNGNVHIKASGVSYTGENDNNNILIVNKSNVTIDIYGNTADRGDKPIIDYVNDKDGGYIFKIMRCSNLTIKNLHFKGVTDSAKTTSLIDFAFTISSNVTINKCVLEGRQAKKALYFEKEVTGIEMTYCYIDTERTDLDSINTNCLDASNSDGGATQLIFQHNIVKNFTYGLYLLYHGTGANRIEHNTFIDAGVGGSNPCIDLGTVNAATTYQIHSNILFGPNDGTGVGLNWTDNGGSVVADYNDVLRYNSSYAGSAIAGVHDLSTDPVWTNYDGLWSYADIFLAAFYYPTVAAVLSGGKSVMGAITLSLTESMLDITGLTQSDGSAWFCRNNELFNRLKTHLVDANIYDTSEAAIGLSNFSVLLSGVATGIPYASLTVYKFYEGETYEAGSVIADAYGAWSIKIKLSHGRSSYYVSDGDYYSNHYHVNAYHLHVWLCAYALEFQNLKDETEQVRQNGHLLDGTDFSGTLITTDGYYLAKNFAQYTSIIKEESVTRAEYQQLLIDVLSAYNLGPSVEAIDLICSAFTGTIPTLTWFKDLLAFEDTDIGIQLRVSSPPSLDYEYDTTDLFLYDRRYNLASGSGTVVVSDSTWLYVDGSVASDTDSELEMQTSLVRPERAVVSINETLSSGLMQVDTYGTNTGVSGELYVIATKFPLALTGVSGSLSPYVTDISSAVLIEHTSNIDLGIAQSAIDKTSVFGNVTLEYSTNYEFLILGLVSTDGSEITGITEIPGVGVGAVARHSTIKENAGTIRIHDSQALVTDIREALFTTLQDVKPAHKFFYIYMEDPITGEQTYYGTI